MNNILYYVVYAVWYTLSLLPLGVLYVFSDVLFYIVYYFVRYRRRLVRKNLVNSFPDKSNDEIVKIEREFYSWFCDYVVESIKLLSMSRNQMARRMVFKGAERVKQSVSEGKSCAVYLGHCCNWEWVTSLPLAMEGEALCGQIYHVLENKAFDRLFLKLRSRMGAVSIPMADTLRRVIEYRQKGEKIVIGFIADQVPFWNSIHYWTDFLHQDTPVLTGTERIARKCGFDVYYLEVKKLRRGYYSAEFKLITSNVSATKDYELTEQYFRMLEKTINEHPAYWLWTHNRWKRTREKWEKWLNARK